MTRSKPLDSRIARTRARLHNAFIELLGSKRLDDISIADIASAADVGYSTFFTHYPNKQALWIAIFQAQVSELSREVRPLFLSREHEGAARRICEFIAERRDIYRVLLVGGAAEQARQLMLDWTRHEAQQYAATFTIDLPPQLGINFGVSALLAILAWWLDGNENIPVEVVSAAVERLVYAPLFQFITG